MKISHYRTHHNEANFGKPIAYQWPGGTHITFEMITVSQGKFFMTRWPKGLPGHDDPRDTLRFPHGLIRLGESLDQCARRLIKSQLGMKAVSVKIAYWDSYLDNHRHWHIEPGCIVHVAGRPKCPAAASEIVVFTLDTLPAMTYWPHRDFLEVVREHLPDLS